MVKVKIVGSFPGRKLFISQISIAMSKRIIISEDAARMIAGYELLSESGIRDVVDSREFKDAVRDIVKSDRNLKKVTEKQVREIVADCVTELLKTLWQRNNFFITAIKN